LPLPSSLPAAWMPDARALALALALAAAPLAAKPPETGQPTGMGDFSAFAVGSPQTGLATTRLTVTAGGKLHAYMVEIAATPQQQATGMMYRKAMPPGTGMLFPMQPARPASFYMRNTYIPLDIIFIGPDRRVRNIGANATPLSDALVSSAGPVSAVLELKGGEAARIGLKPGDKVAW
jgi:uncharacterized protein